MTLLLIERIGSDKLSVYEIEAFASAMDANTVLQSVDLCTKRPRDLRIALNPGSDVLADYDVQKHPSLLEVIYGFVPAPHTEL